MIWTSETHYLDNIDVPLKVLTDAGWTIFQVLPRGDSMATVIAFKN